MIDIYALKTAVEKLREENENLRRSVHGSTFAADEADDLAQGTDADDSDSAINNRLVLTENSVNETNE